MVDNQIKPREKLISNGFFEQKTMADLIKIYNKTRPRKHIRKFESVAQAVRMLLERLVYLERIPPHRRPKGGRPIILVDIPPNKSYTGNRDIRRKSQKLLVDLVTYGITAENLIKAMGWKSRANMKKNMSTVNKSHGYGFKEDSKGAKLRILS